MQIKNHPQNTQAERADMTDPKKIFYELAKPLRALKSQPAARQVGFLISALELTAAEITS